MTKCLLFYLKLSPGPSVSDLTVVPEELAAVACLLAEGVIAISSSMLSREGNLRQNPTTLEAFFRLLASATEGSQKDA